MLSQLTLRFHKKLIEALVLTLTTVCKEGSLAEALTGLRYLYGDL